MRAAVLALCVAAAPAAAQVAVNHGSTYLFVTAATDARTIWVNPARLGVTREASVALEIVSRDPGPDGTFGQLTAGLSSRGFGLSYQYDYFGGGSKAGTWRVALAASAGRLAIGGAGAIYGEGETGFDIGGSFAAAPWATLGLVTLNISEPVVRGLEQTFAVAGGATVTPFGPAVSLSAQGRFAGDPDREGYALGLAWQNQRGLPIGLGARLDTDADARRRAFAFYLSFGARDRVGTVLTTPPDVSGVDEASLVGVASRPLSR